VKLPVNSILSGNNVSSATSDTHAIQVECRSCGARGPLCIPSENEAPCRIVGACLLKYGYARVSTDDQTPALQLAALRKAGCKTVFKDDGLSGATTERPARSHFPVVTRTPIWVEP
jgi:resolvase-like protein